MGEEVDQVVVEEGGVEGAVAEVAVEEQGGEAAGH